MQWPGRAAHEVLVLDIDKALGLSDGPDVGLLAAAGGGPMGRGEQPRAWGPGQAGTIPPPGQGSMGRRGASGPPLWVGGHPPPTPERGGGGGPPLRERVFTLHIQPCSRKPRQTNALLPGCRALSVLEKGLGLVVRTSFDPVVPGEPRCSRAPIHRILHFGSLRGDRI